MNFIRKYFPELSSHQLDQFSQLNNLYTEWNDKINVISRKDIEHLEERHVLHSLSIAKLISFKKNSKILDIGTGGGFPGIPLAILFPEVKFHLVDSIGKKIHVVKEISEALHLQNISCKKNRAENVEGKYDFVVSRAVAEFSKIVAWTKSKIKKEGIHDLPNGIICLKGGDLSLELSMVKEKAKIYNLSQWYDEEFFLEKKIVFLPV